MTSLGGGTAGAPDMPACAVRGATAKVAVPHGNAGVISVSAETAASWVTQPADMQHAPVETGEGQQGNARVPGCSTVCMRLDRCVSVIGLVLGDTCTRQPAEGSGESRELSKWAWLGLAHITAASRSSMTAPNPRILCVVAGPTFVLPTGSFCQLS